MYVSRMIVRGYLGQDIIEAAREPRTLQHDVCKRSYWKMASCVYHSPIRRFKLLKKVEIIIFYHD